MARYNGFVDAKKDDDFDKPAESLTKKIEQGPFHAVRLVLCVHNLTAAWPLTTMLKFLVKI